MAKNDKRALVCCRYCGRDTRAADEVCAACRGGMTFPVDHNSDQRNRSARDSQTLGGSPLDFVDEEYEPNPEQTYHGRTIRDDI